MGYVGKLELKIKVRELRKQGLSYKEILQKIPVSKDSISRWCQDIELSNAQKKKLQENRIFGQKKGSQVAAENKKVAKEKKIKEIHAQAVKEIGNLKNREEFLIGIALYAAEGTKMDKHGGFSNADPELVKFMMKWFLEYAKVPKEKLRGRIWIHENLDEKRAKDFWSKISGISLQHFTKTYFAKDKNAKKIRKNIHEYGVFYVSFSDATIHRKIIGWILAVFNDKISA
ncbi:MAG: hypothetical protein ACREGI_02715 [Candidatus Levyibacteriota bacterium]